MDGVRGLEITATENGEASRFIQMGKEVGSWKLECMAAKICLASESMYSVTFVEKGLNFIFLLVNIEK